MREYTVAQMDAVLELAAIDEPKKYSFTRADDKVTEAIDANVGWLDRLSGEGLADRLARLVPRHIRRALADFEARKDVF